MTFLNILIEQLYILTTIVFWERENTVWITSIIYFCTRMIIYLFCQVKKGQSLVVNAVTLV